MIAVLEETLLLFIVAELLHILIVLILVLALTAVVWRYATRLEVEQPSVAPSAPSETGAG